MLLYLTKINPNKRKFKWTKAEQYAFNKIKQIPTRDNLLTYTDFNNFLKFTLMLARSNWER